MVMLRAIVYAKNEPIPELQSVAAAADLATAKIADTSIYYGGRAHDAVIYTREGLSAGVVVPGPAIINEMDSTTVVLPGHSATVDDIRNLLINPVGAVTKGGQSE